MQYFYDHIFFKAYYPSPSMHKHFAKHMIFAPEGMLECKVCGDEFKCKGVIIQSNILHTVDICKMPMLVYLFDETCNRAKMLDDLYLSNKPYAILNDDICQRVIKAEKTFKTNVDSKILKICCLHKGGAIKYDERIKNVLNIINDKETLNAGIMGELCSRVFLSESRLSHLFRDQVGTSLAGYIMFSKLSKAYNYMMSGENITQAAIHAGFSSSSHFAAVNKKLFGLSVKEIGSVEDILNTAEK